MTELKIGFFVDFLSGKYVEVKIGDTWYGAVKDLPIFKNGGTCLKTVSVLDAKIYVMFKNYPVDRKSCVIFHDMAYKPFWNFLLLQGMRNFDWAIDVLFDGYLDIPESFSKGDILYIHGLYKQLSRFKLKWINNRLISDLSRREIMNIVNEFERKIISISYFGGK